MQVVLVCTPYLTADNEIMPQRLATAITTTVQLLLLQQLQTTTTRAACKSRRAESSQAAGVPDRSYHYYCTVCRVDAP